MKWWLLLFALWALPAWAQKYPERRVVRAGNRAYERGEWQAAADKYQRALELQPESREAAGNLGNALFRQEKWTDAAAAFEGAAAAESDAVTSGKYFYGQGTALAHERKLQEALESLKNAMRANPDDQDAKFNYAYVKKLLDEQNKNGGGDKDKDKDKDNDKDKNKDKQNGQDKQDKQGQNKQDKQDGQNGQNQQDQQGQQGQNGQDQQGQNQQDQQGQNGQDGQAAGGMSREDAERMLQAMQAQEDQTRDKMDDQQRAVAVGRSGKNW